VSPWEKFCEVNALKLCKPHQAVGLRGVSCVPWVLFHRVIHTCVQNFTPQKYFAKVSAELVHCNAQKFMFVAGKLELSPLKRDFPNG
jgi:hypothetical protein